MPTRKFSFFISHFSIKKGFTLIELLVVIAIIGILASIAIVSYGSAQQRARDSQRKQGLESIKKALQLAKQDTPGAYYYPKCDTGAGCVLSDTNTNQDLAPTYIKAVPLDPKTASGYTYTPQPGSCNNTSTFCTSYILTACLENGNDPQGITDIGSCPTSPNKKYTVTPD